VQKYRCGGADEVVQIRCRVCAGAGELVQVEQVQVQLRKRGDAEAEVMQK
jgi:DnaJ-class molecular chaperone